MFRNILRGLIWTCRPDSPSIGSVRRQGQVSVANQYGGLDASKLFVLTLSDCDIGDIVSKRGGERWRV
jgi:hypothetical protein